MYEHVFQFFGLRENPFHVSPDPRFFFSTRSHSSALANLQMGVASRQGFIVLTGEAGTGKTILLHQFLNWLQSRQQSTCYIFQSQLRASELFESILRDFGVSCDSRRKGELLAALKQWLLRRHSLGDSPVLIIDEGQAVSLRTLDRLRMLLNLEVPGGKLLQIVLAGQPQLDEKLRRPELRQLHQRIMVRCSLGALSMEETAEYVKARLVNGGLKDSNIFPEESMEAVHIYSEGIPRVVNLLCEHALLRAFVEKQCVISQDTVSRVAEVFELGPRPASTTKREASVRFGRLTPTHADETVIAPAHADPGVTEVKMEVTSVPLVATSVEQGRAESKPKTEPDWKKIEAPVLASAATVGINRPAVTKPLRAQSPIIALVEQREPEILELKQAGPKELPLNWARPGVGDRFLDYLRAVEQSFVRDLKQFVQGIPTVKKAPGRFMDRV
jgi:general secretion pathway protein A